MLISRGRKFPYQAVSFKGEEVHELMPKNETVIHITILQKMTDFSYSDLIKCLHVKIPKSWLKRDPARKIEVGPSKKPSVLPKKPSVSQYLLRLCGASISLENEKIGSHVTFKVQIDTPNLLEVNSKLKLVKTKHFPDKITLVDEEVLLQHNNELFVTYQINGKLKPISSADLVKCTLGFAQKHMESSLPNELLKDLTSYKIEPAEENIPFDRVQAGYVRVRVRLCTRKKVPKTTKVFLKRKNSFRSDPKLLLEDEVHVRNSENELILRFIIGQVSH